ncbi:hypothetical protein ACJX0J_014322, partial [Zea mays]
ALFLIRIAVWLKRVIPQLFHWATEVAMNEQIWSLFWTIHNNIFFAFPVHNFELADFIEICWLGYYSVSPDKLLIVVSCEGSVEHGSWVLTCFTLDIGMNCLGPVWDNFTNKNKEKKKKNGYMSLLLKELCAALIFWAQ